MRNKTKKIISAFLTLAMMLGLFWGMAIPASAANAQSLADQINAFDHGGNNKGNLTAVASGNKVTVTGKVTDVTNTLELDIDSGVTVIWTAAYSGIAPDQLPPVVQRPTTNSRNVLQGDLIHVGGQGIFEVSKGGSVISGGTGHAIVAVSRGVTINVSGGAVNGAREYHAIYLGAGSCTVNVSGGTVEAGKEGSSVSAAIYAPNAASTINISGGSVKSQSGHVIYSYDVSFVCNVSGGELISENAGGGIYSNGKDAKITVSGGTLLIHSIISAIYIQGANSIVSVEKNANIIQTAYDGVINAFGDNDVINVSGGTLSTEAGNVIGTSGASAKITVSGGVLKSNQGDVIRSSGANTDIIITGGEISALGNTQLENVITGEGVRASGNSSKIYIDGGTISSARQFAVYHEGENAIINMNGGNLISINGGAALRTEKAEAAVYMSGGTIVAGFGHGIWTNGINSQIYLSGGVINVTGDGGRGIFTEGAHSLINMKGGLVSAWGDSGNAICDFGTNTIIEISDGFVFNCAKAITGEYDVIRMLVGEPQIAGSSVVIAWNRSAGNTVYADGTSDDLVLAPAGASAFWTTGGIKYANGLNTGTFAIDGISIASDEPEPTPAQPPDEPPPPPTASMENFVTASTNTYVPGTFEDVDNAWYEQNVAIVYECGLMLGYGNGFFGAQNTITVVEVITVAARVHSIYLSGFVVPMTSSLPPETAPWYAGIMEYAIANGIVKADDFSEADYGRAATRAEMAYVFSKTLPPEEFPAQNIVNSIPDVPNTLKYAKEIHTMYKAGIISGVDEAGTFLPNNNITRAEAAAIISRVIFPDQRGAGHTFG